MPKISVIVPVYNAEKYLHRCIDSILAQTFTDFELLLINDGSKDSSGVICDEYAAKDSRVLVFHKENGGVSSARNMGLDNAKGEWISFVDSDDWVEKEYLETLYQDGEFDFVTCYWNVLENNDVLEGVFHADREYYGLNDIRLFLDDNERELLYPVCRLFRKTIIDRNEIRFNQDLNYGEDILFVMSYIIHIQSAKQVYKIMYFYEKHINSLSTSYVKWEDLDLLINLVGEKISELERKFIWNASRMSQYLIWSIFLRKYFAYLQYNVNVYKCKNELKIISNNLYVSKVFLSSSDKGIARKIIDFLMRKRMFGAVAVILKIEHLIFLMLRSR